MNQIQLAITATLLMAIGLVAAQIRVMTQLVRQGEDNKSLVLMVSAFLTSFFAVWLVIRLANTWKF